MRKPRLLSLCSGIGAIDLAAIIAGCEIAGQVEIDSFGLAVLLKNFGELPRRADIKEVATYDAETLTGIFGDIDIVAGGIPCQPFSSAGKRRGVEDDRHLWPYAFAIIQTAQPTWVFIENVRNFVPLALDLVLSDLESAHYEARAVVLPACAIGAPHIRERCFILAHLSGERGGTQRAESEKQQRATIADCDGSELAYPKSSERERSRDTRHRWNGSANLSESMAYPGGNRCGIRKNQQERQPRSVGLADAGIHGTQATLAYANGTGRQEQHASTISGEVGHVARRTPAPGNGMADSQYGRCERGMLDTIQPGATLLRGCATTGAELECRVGRDAYGAARWMDGHIWPALPGEAQHPQEPPRTITDKQPNRNKRLKALGNTVVWQQVYPFFAFIAQQYADQ